MKYELLKREVVYSGRAFEVAVHEYRLPDQRVRSYDVVEHLPAVTMVPLDADGNLIFVRQYRVGGQVDLLELPAGVLHDGEDPAEGAGREVREETGMAAGKLTRLGGFYMAPGYSSEYMYVFLATDLSPDPLPMDDDEFLEISKISFTEALEMARRGEMQDGKTIVALMLAERFLKA